MLVPPPTTKLTEGFIVPLVKLNVVLETVNVVQLIVSAIVGIPEYKVTAPVVFPLYVNVPEPRIFTVNEVYVPLDDNVKPVKSIVVVPKVNEVVPKSSFFKTPLVVIVATEAPVVNVKFGGKDVEPLVPQVNVLATLMSSTVNPPGPEHENLLITAILSTTVAAVVCVSCILPALVVPKLIERVLETLELNIPVLNVTPSANVNIPPLSV